MHQSDPLLELLQTQNRWKTIRPEQKINILNFDEITSQAGRQPAQFAQLAPERAGLQGEHYFHAIWPQQTPMCHMRFLHAKYKSSSQRTSKPRPSALSAFFACKIQTKQSRILVWSRELFLKPEYFNEISGALCFPCRYDDLVPASAQVSYAFFACKIQIKIRS